MATHKDTRIMKSTLSPESLAQLDFLIDSLDELYQEAFPALETCEMAKLSTARGDLAFVRARVGCTPVVRLVVLDRQVVTA